MMMLKPLPPLALPLFAEFIRSSRATLLRLSLGLAVSAGVLTSSGCGVSRLEPPSVNATGFFLHGHASGGQQPVSGAAIMLYAAGSAGNGSASTPMLGSAVLSDAHGGFNITAAYNCPTASTQVYIAATGGNPGLPGNVNNGALALLAALGDCGSLSSIPNIAINEVTTAAAAWALAPFASSVAAIGSTSTNTAGLTNGMRNARVLADSTTGVAPSPLLPANASIETAKLYSLADIIANCVNSDGTSTCSTLFSDATAGTASAPSDTFQAALSIVSHPANHVAALFNDAPPQPAFGGALSNAPSDWTMSITYSGGGLSSPNAVAIDASGNAWVANYTGAVAGFLPQGSPMYSNGISGAGLAASSGIAIDASQNIWVTNRTTQGGPNLSGSVTELAPGGSILSQPFGYVAGVNSPSAISYAPNGSFWIVNLGSALVSLLDSSGNPLSGSNGFGTGFLQEPVAVASDQFSNVWVADKTAGTLTHMDRAGNVLRQAACSSHPDALALDSRATVWIADSTASVLTQAASNGIPVATITDPRLSTPRALAVDGGGHVFVANMGGNNIAMLTDSTSSTPGAFLSPTGGLGIDAHMIQPYGVAVDASGSLWVTSSGNDRLLAFIGLAAPVKTQGSGLPQQP